ncbi:MAG: hypothetical protein R3332_05305 [Pseudohongiellaceae bacterium]|nr:hypothetical protein [Pseudohongiellaceae bacterium]
MRNNNDHGKGRVQGQLLGALLLSCMVGSAYGADQDADGLSLPDFTELGAWGWLEQRRDSMSKNVSGVGRYLDDWLSGDVVGEHSNQSYLRLRLNQKVSSTGNYYSNARISGRVDLPRATERWKLIFESEEAELESLRNQRLDNIRSSSISGGFSYEMRERSNGLRFTHDVGIKGSIPLDPFYRFKTRYGTDISDNWSLDINQKFWFYHTDGWGQDARISFSRLVDEDMYLRVQSEVNYRDRRDQFEYAQTVSLHRTLGERETLTYEAGVIGISQPNPRVESYYAQSVYRKAIYEDWLIMELVPQLIMEREEDWDPDPRIQFNLEVYFFDF